MTSHRKLENFLDPVRTRRFGIRMDPDSTNLDLFIHYLWPLATHDKSNIFTSDDHNNSTYFPIFFASHIILSHYVILLPNKLLRLFITFIGYSKINLMTFRKISNWKTQKSNENSIYYCRPMPLHPPKYASTLHSALKAEKSCNQQVLVFLKVQNQCFFGWFFLCFHPFHSKSVNSLLIVHFFGFYPYCGSTRLDSIQTQNLEKGQPQLKQGKICQKNLEHL